jgi:hypothetical protein
MADQSGQNHSPDLGKENNSILEEERIHAEFFGYSTIKNPDGALTISTETNDLWWWWLIKIRYGIIARRYLFTKNRNVLNDCLELVNEYNKYTRLVKANLIEEENGSIQIFFEATLIGIYNKSNFSIFIQEINREMQIFVTQPNIFDVWKEIRDDEEQ